MVYGRFRRRFKRRFSFIKRRFRRTFRGRISATRRIQRRHGLLRRRRIYPELKFNDNPQVSLNALDLATGTTPILCFNQIPAGDTAESRDGAKVNIKSWALRFSIIHNINATTSANFRIIGFVARDMNGVMPTPTQILDDTTSVQSFLTLNNSRNNGITILFDKWFNFHNPNNAAFTVRYRFWNYFKKLNMISTYTGTGSAITDIATNGLCILSYSSYPDTPSTNPQILVNSRVRWTDC